MNIIPIQNFWGAVKSGVPQGLWSEPFFFMVYLKSMLLLFSNKFLIRFCDDKHFDEVLETKLKKKKNKRCWQ